MRLRLLGIVALLLMLTAAAGAQDFDGDAIPDAVENEAWYIAAGGDPDRADVWVECDYMPGTVKKRGKIVKRTETVFERAPVGGGIVLHVTFDDRIPFEERWGDVDTLEGFLETRAEALEARAAHFDGHPFEGDDATTMRDYMHYCVYVNAIDYDGTSGYSFDSTRVYGGIPGDLFVVSLGLWPDFPGVTPELLRRYETGTLLHELGHNLGLTHGGANPGRHANFKPNYLSVMNYFFTGGFVRVRNGQGEFFKYWDYSWFTTNFLDEHALDESEGVSAPPEAVVTQDEDAGTLYGLSFCPGGTDIRLFTWNAPRDWDCDGVLDPGTLAADVTGDGKRTKLGRGQVNWEHLVFDGGAIAGAGSRMAPVFLDPATEVDLPAQRRLVELVDAAPPPPPDAP